jgi:hypothetical protein
VYVARVEGVEREVAALDDEDRERRRAQDDDLEQVAGAHPEQVAEDDVVEVGRARGHRDEDESEREERREDDPHRGVFLDAARAAHDADQCDREQPEGERSDGEGQAEDVGEDDAGQHGVRDGVAHE